MRAIVLPRAAGKTSRMMRWLLGDRRRVLIVYSVRERTRLRDLFKVGGEVEPALVDVTSRIVCMAEIANGMTRGRWPGGAMYGIDELDLVLTGIIGGPVEVVSFSGEIEAWSG